MARMKIEYNVDQEIEYTPERWQILKNLRTRAMRITEIFARHNIESLTFGSVARGDVKSTSDIDIVLLTKVPTFQVEVLLDEAKERIQAKTIVQATPNDVIKAHYDLDDEICLSVLLTDFTHHPYEFYYFGGAVTHAQMEKSERVPGIDKRLVLIQPSSKGHHEISVVDHPGQAANIIGISSEMVEQRIRVLTRRDKIGRTGIFLNQEIGLDENFEEKLAEIAASNQLVRRRVNL